jgi:predicted MPP superfamily phosphohydrolase
VTSSPKQVSRRALLRGAGYGLAGSLFSAAYADYSVHNPQLERVELRLKRWKADGLRVGFITDIHVNDPDEMARARRAAEMLAATKPDILLFGGDCVNSSRQDGIDNIALALDPLKDLTCPKLAVLGNHDYASGAVEEIVRALGNAGFRILRNETAIFPEFRVAGYDDQLWGNRDPKFVPNDHGTIALLHEPDSVDHVPETLSLQLSGHSHGGQICIPFGLPLHTPKGARKYRRGFFPNARVPLYVSRGVGTTAFKWRLFCPPEVTLLALRSA